MNSSLALLYTVGFTVLMIGVPAVITLAIVFAYRSNRRAEAARMRALQGYAASRGWAYAQHVPGVIPRFGNVTPFGRGEGREFSNFIGFYVGKLVAHSFDYKFVISSGKSSETHYFHVVALELPAALPQLELRPEGAEAKIAGFFGMQDLQFESDEFNRAWHIKSSNPSFAHEVVNPMMIEWLMQDHQRFANFAIDRDTLYTTISGRQDPRRIDALVWYLTQFLDRVPAFVWDKAK